MVFQKGVLQAVSEARQGTKNWIVSGKNDYELLFHIKTLDPECATVIDAAYHVVADAYGGTSNQDFSESLKVLNVPMYCPFIRECKIHMNNRTSSFLFNTADCQYSVESDP